MNILQRSLVEKAGHDNGFEHVLAAELAHGVIMGSALHPALVAVQHATGADYCARLQTGSPALQQELARSFPGAIDEQGEFHFPTEGALAGWLRRTATLATALPNQVVSAYEAKVEAELAELGSVVGQNTEVRRMVRQRLGQQAFRQAMLDYWGGACAVTGLALPQALRASHAKPWAECETDAERLDVYNGFLLSANLDALFDGFLISFSDTGHLLVSTAITTADQAMLGLTAGMQLRWLDQKHQPYLSFHRDRFGRNCPYRTV